MRWLFLFVLLVNVAYVSWELSQPKAELVEPGTNADIPTIELLSEIGQATKNPKQPSVQDEAGSGAPKLAEASNSTSDKASAQTAKPAKQPSIATSTVTIPDTDRCYTLGPFRELDNLREFTRAIKSYVTTASFRSRDEQEQSLFWVFLKPSATFKAAKALGKRLESVKIKDYYVINTGPQQKGISLGHFKGKDRAYAHADGIKKLGFKPIVEPVFKSYTIYWLDYEVPAGKVIPQKIFAKQLAKNINRLDRSCS